MKKSCKNCLFLVKETPDVNCPYPVEWCQKGHHDGGNYEELEKETECADWCSWREDPGIG